MIDEPFDIGILQQQTNIIMYVFLIIAMSQVLFLSGEQTCVSRNL